MPPLDGPKLRDIDEVVASRYLSKIDLRQPYAPHIHKHSDDDGNPELDILYAEERQNDAHKNPFYRYPFLADSPKVTDLSARSRRPSGTTATQEEQQMAERERHTRYAQENSDRVSWLQHQYKVWSQIRSLRNLAYEKVTTAYHDVDEEIRKASASGSLSENELNALRKDREIFAQNIHAIQQAFQYASSTYNSIRQEQSLAEIRSNWHKAKAAGYNGLPTPIRTTSPELPEGYISSGESGTADPDPETLTEKEKQDEHVAKTRVLHNRTGEQ